MNFPTLCADETGERGRPATLACKPNFKKSRGGQNYKKNPRGECYANEGYFFMASHDMIASMLLLFSLDFSRMKIIGSGNVTLT